MTKPILQKNENEITHPDTQQQLWSDRPLSWSYLAGLIQTDGSFSFNWTRRDAGFLPRIHISFGQSRFSFAKEKIQPFLQSHGIRSQLQPSTLEGCKRIGQTQGLNIYVENISNVKTFIEKLENEFSFANRICFANSKLKDYLVLKAALDLHQKQKDTRSKEEKK